MSFDERGADETRSHAALALYRWRTSGDHASIRGARAFAEFPEGERKDRLTFRAEMENLAGEIEEGLCDPTSDDAVQR